MKIVSYRRGGGEGFGVVKGDGVVGMASRTSYRTLKSALAGFAIGEMESIARIAPPDFGVDELEYMFPVTEPESIFCVGRNYRAYHEVLEDGGPEWPSIFARYPQSFSAHGQEIFRPRVSEQLDYEGEIGVVIGKAGRHVPEERALDHVAGYTIVNEGSVRDWQSKGTQNCPGKNFHRSGAIGPWMVTRDEIDDLDALRIRTTVDGEVRQDGGSDMMIFKIPFVIAHISRFTWLAPGDIIATGSPGGSAIEGDPPRWLAPGQTVSVEIEPIGVLTNTVAAE